jgi:putative beta-lysine N-acetyltransferase
MSDIMEFVGRSVIQHGKYNDRAYLMKLHSIDSHDIVRHLHELASSNGYTKIFAKIPASALELFMEDGYEQEASIPNFFPDGEAACFLGKYFSASRREEGNPRLVRDVLDAAGKQEHISSLPPLPAGFTSRIAVEEDVDGMAEVYRKVFATYPFPIHDPGFLRSAMNDATIYFGVWNGNEIVALSSAETDPASLSAEMTDFATVPEYRGLGLALHLLRRMEQVVQSRGIRSFFTIARAYSFGMNITFARNGYSFGGTLVNNTNISGDLESMNVWYKAPTNGSVSTAVLKYP